MKFLREEGGKPILVEFWVKDGKIVMLRRTTNYEENGEERKFRQDIPVESSKFQEELLKELQYLRNMTKQLEVLSGQGQSKREERPEPVPKSKSKTSSRLAYTAALLRQQQS